MKTLFYSLLALLAFPPFSIKAKEAPDEAPEGVTIKHDLAFLEEGRGEKLDLYQPSQRDPDTPSPAVVIIHGGGWVKGDKNREREYVTGTSLAKAGYLCISINYETRKEHRWPNNLHDCKNAVRWLRTNADKLKIDPERIGVIGGSAGGHLALMLAYTADDPLLSPPQPYPGVSDKVSACVDMYGITNLLTRCVTDDDGQPTDELKSHRLFTESREEAPEKWKLASPVTHITKSSPPTLILHGTRDTVVDRGQSEELHQALNKAGVENEYLAVKGAGHAWPLRTKDFDYTDEMVAFFNKHLKDSPRKEASPLPADAPNVLFISVDDLNDWTGSLGGHPQAITPNLDKLAKQGVLFTNAHCSQAVCNASRNSLLSGLHPSSVGWYGSTKIMQNSYQEVMGDHVMLPQYFKDRGYHTLAVGKVFHAGVSDYKDRTDDFWNETGPRYSVRGDLRKRGDGYKGTQFYPFPKDGAQMSRHYGKDYEDGNSLACGPLDREDMPDGKMYDEIIAEWAATKLKEQSKPFFLAVGFVRPHAPFTAPREFFDLYQRENIEMPDVPDDEMADVPLMGKAIAYGRLKGGDHHAVTNLSDTYWQEMLHGYLASVSFVDAQIGKVMTALEESGQEDNTIIVLWSDHGQHLGEKKKWRKQSLWEEATRVPLVFKVPALKTAGDTCDEVVSLLDIYPTLVQACGLPPASRLEGQSLVPFLEDPEKERAEPVLMSWYYGNHAVRSKDWRYIQYRDGTQELYRHPQDPKEHQNLAQDPQSTEVIKELKKWIPENPALPAGDTEWGGDKLDRLVIEWNGSKVPDWLK